MEDNNRFTINRLFSGKELYKALWILIFTGVPWVATQVWDYKHQVDENTEEIKRLSDADLRRQGDLTGIRSMSITNGTEIEVLKQQQASDRRDIDRLYKDTK